MGLSDAFFHLLNFLAPAWVTAAVGAMAMKLIWRQALRGVPARRLAWRCAWAGSVVLAAGLALWGRDGKMATYGTLVAVQALVAMWTGFGPARR